MTQKKTDTHTEPRADGDQPCDRGAPPRSSTAGSKLALGRAHTRALVVNLQAYEHAPREDLVEAHDIARRLASCHCNERANPYCKLERLCYRCNRKMQQEHWREYGRFAKAMLEAGATPYMFRLGAPEDRRLRAHYAKTKARLEKFLRPMKSGYSLRVTDLFAAPVAGGFHGLHVLKRERSWYLHVHGILWVRPASSQRATERAVKILKLHWARICDGQEQELHLQRIGVKESKSLLDQIERVHHYAMKTWEVVEPGDVVEAVRFFRGVKTIGRFGSSMRTLQKNRLAPMDITASEIEELVETGAISRKRRLPRKIKAPPPPRACAPRSTVERANAAMQPQSKASPRSAAAARTTNRSRAATNATGRETFHNSVPMSETERAWAAWAEDTLADTRRQTA